MFLFEHQALIFEIKNVDCLSERFSVIIHFHLIILVSVNIFGRNDFQKLRKYSKDLIVKYTVSHRLNNAFSDLKDLYCTGTSAGGFIAAGLSVPSWKILYELSLL
uniref:PNPLA domain-containing protein n=1 Tax=Rhizophagus irregularis (strain DAOM 181602 / DAOM 197198 / MUCL 43194) TaxID=747089 RepID=U9UMV4_RHIID